MYDFLHAVDWVCDDPVKTAHRVADVLGLPQVRDSWRQTLPTHDYEAVFSRAGVSMASAPTRLEFIRALDGASPSGGCSVAPIRSVSRWQGRRAQRWHATVVCTPDLDASLDDLRGRGTPVFVEPGCAHLPHRRAWVGWRGEGVYDPSHDAGLLLELIPTSALGDKIVSAVHTAHELGERVVRRVHLVVDLDASVRALERSVGIEPASPTTMDVALGAQTARYVFAHDQSAELVLAEPAASGAARSYLDSWGEGPVVTTFARTDSTATLERALDIGAKRSAAFPSLNVVMHDDAPGMLFELTDVALS